MFTTTRAVLTLGSLCLALSLRLEAQPQEKTVLQRKREVEEGKLQLLRAQRQLALKSAELALAEGKRDLAISELASVVALYQSEARWIREHANWFCDPRDLTTENLWETAKVSVRLATLKGDTATQVVEWKKIVGFHEQDLKRVERLAQLGAIKPEEKSAAAEGLAKARQQLEAAEKRAAEQGKKIDSPN